MTGTGSWRWEVLTGGRADSSSTAELRWKEGLGLSFLVAHSMKSAHSDLWYNILTSCQPVGWYSSLTWLLRQLGTTVCVREGHVMAGERLNSSSPYLDLFKLLSHQIRNVLKACALKGVAEQKGWKKPGLSPWCAPHKQTYRQQRGPVSPSGCLSSSLRTWKCGFSIETLVFIF